MAHISYSLFEELKESAHGRKLAKQLNINHMTVARKLKELEIQNVVDFKFEGKNKYYFRKKSIETEFFKKQVECQKALNFIKENPQYRQLVEDIIHNPKIQLAVIFGSYAKKTQTKTSDLDIFIENVSKDIIKDLTILYSTVSIKSGKYNQESLLGKEIQKKHIILRGVDYYEQIHQKTM